MRDSGHPFETHGHRHRLRHARLRRALTVGSPSARDASFRGRRRQRSSTHRPGHHVADCSARLDPVKAFRFAPTPFGAYGLDRLSVEPREGTYAMAGQTGRTFEKDTTIRNTTIRDTSPTPNIAVAKCPGARLADLLGTEIRRIARVNQP